MKRLVVAVALASSGCMNLDNFVFRTPRAETDPVKLMEESQVPERLRHLNLAVPSDAEHTVAVYLAHHDGGEGDVSADPARNAVTVIYCHGQSNHLGGSHPRVEVLWKQGFNVAIVSPRGYGPSPGKPTQKGVVTDMKAARAYVESLSQFGVDPARIGLYGRSLGSALCLTMTEDSGVGAIVLESPIGSLQSFVNDSLSFEAPSEWLFDASFDNFVSIQRHTGPLLVMHGTADDFVQPKYGKQVSESAEGHASPNEFWSVPGADHGNIPCAEKRAVDKAKDSDTRSNACAGGFDAEYVAKVTALFDRLKPQGP